MDNYPINLIQVTKSGKHKLIDKLLFFGINTLEEYFQQDQEELTQKLLQISDDLLQQIQDFQEQAQLIKEKFLKLEVDDMEFIDSSEDEEQQQQEKNDNTMFFHNSIPLILGGVEPNQQELNYYYYKQENQKNIQLQLNQVVNFGEITEIVGQLGAGKTQFCMQILQNFCLYCKITRKNYQSLVIDFDGSFIAQRFQSFSNTAFEKYKLQQETALNSINIFKHLELINLNELLLAIEQKYFQESQQKQLKLIIIDGIMNQIKSKMIRYEDQKEVHSFLQQLQSIAKKYECAIVFTNQIQNFQKNKNQPNSLIQKSEYASNISSFVSNKIMLQKMQIKKNNNGSNNQGQLQQQQQIQYFMNGKIDDRKSRNKKTVCIVQKCSTYLDRAIEVPIETIFTQTDGVQFYIK